MSCLSRPSAGKGHGGLCWCFLYFLHNSVMSAELTPASPSKDTSVYCAVRYCGLVVVCTVDYGGVGGGVTPQFPWAGHECVGRASTGRQCEAQTME